jgi:Protein of unknown function (DUF3300)
MKPDLPDRLLHPAISICRRALPAVFFLTLAAVPLCAQQSAGQNWPPDDDAPGGAQPQPIPSYSPDGQPGYNQQQDSQGYPQQPYADVPQSPAQQPYGQQPLSADQLAQLIAPIALYPDALIAQILAASTYPAQISPADQWLQSMGNASPQQIAAAADAQTSWDPSIKALTAFPQVLSMLDRNLQWTTSLGNAYYNQPQDVLQTIQVMRERAQDAGNLQSTPQVDVQENQGYVAVAPANPQIVYVPTYDPWTVYGQPVNPYPGFYTLGPVGPFYGPVQYGMGFAISAFLGAPWGWFGWGLNWYSHAVVFNHNDYCTRSRSVRDWGLPYGGPRAYPGYPHSIHGGSDYASAHNGYNHASPSGSGFNRSYPHPVGGPVNHWGDARTQQGFNRSFPSRNDVYGHPSAPTQQAFAGREQPGRQAYNSGFSAAPHNNYINRTGMALSAPSQSYRGQQYNDPRNTYSSNRAYNSYNGSNGFNRSGGPGSYGSPQVWRQPQQRSGASPLFGGAHNSDSVNGRAPQTYSYNGGGHGNWGNSGGGWKAPQAPHQSFGGGSHSFFGGSGGGSSHSFSGGHSSGGGGHSFGGGGHSSGGGSHGGGGHHR